MAQDRKLQSATKWVETLCPKLGFFYVLLASKVGNIAFPPPSPPCSVVPMFELPVENNKHPNFEWRGQGRGADSIVLWSYPIWVQCLTNFVAGCRCVMYQFRHYNVSRVLPSNYFFFLLELCWKMFPKQRLCAVFGFQEWRINRWSVQFSLCGLQNQSSRRTHSG